MKNVMYFTYPFKLYYCLALEEARFAMLPLGNLVTFDTAEIVEISENLKYNNFPDGHIPELLRHPKEGLRC